MKMHKAKREWLEQRGWKVGTADEFLVLSPEESEEELAEEFDLESFMNRPVHWTSRIWYWLLRKINQIRSLPEEIKWLVQRAKRGYSDSDVWDFHYYLLDILIGGLTLFRDKTGAYPPEMTYEEWIDTLTAMIGGFKLDKMVVEDDKIPYLDEIPDYFTEERRKNVFTKEEQQKRDNAYDLLKKHFYNLWW